MFGARFDDVTNGGAFTLNDPMGTIVAERPEDVVGALEAAARAARDGAWVAGYVTYEAAQGLDPVLRVTPDRSGRPLVWFGVFGGRTDHAVAVHDPATARAYALSSWHSEIDRDAYETAFATVHDHIRDGDTYQVNLTFPLAASYSGAVDVLYQDLVCAQRPAYAAHLWHDDTHVVSISPERFFAIDGDRISTQPMKGTASRGRWPEEDIAYRDALTTSEKDRAENLMIVDLVRNDLGKIAETGTVVASDMFAVSRFRTVWQMTSSVDARLRDDQTLVDVFTALFPCGSVTGAPKGRSMEIIADVESEPRGVYCGAVGFIPPGDGRDGASFNVAIRTAVIDTAEGVASYGVGGGITWSSEVDKEYAEAVTKSEVLRFDVSAMALLEAIRWDQDYVWLERHLDRLAASAEYWSFAFDRRAALSMLEEFQGGLEYAAKVRLVLGAEGAMSVTATEAPMRWHTGPGPSDDVVLLEIDREPIDEMNPRMYHKTSDRRPFRVRRDRHPDADDVLLVNRFGHITESTVANVVFLIDGVWWTPPVADGLLGGVLRRVLLDDGVLAERSVTVSDALAADAVALVSSVRGWRPARIHTAGVLGSTASG